jgi:hypothetical protein
MIVSIYGDRSPMAVRYNMMLLEAYNRRPEGPDRTLLIGSITDANFKIIKDVWGPESLFGIRVYLTAYLSSMIRGDGERTADIFDDMNALKYRGKPITQNRYLFKARI